MSNRQLDKPRVVDNEIFEGGNGFKAIVVQTSGFVNRMSELGATERYLQRFANHKSDVDLVYLTVGRDLDLVTKGLNDLSQFFPREADVPVIFKRQHQVSMLGLRKHDRNVAMCSAITLPTKREPDHLMKSISQFQDLATTETITTLAKEHHERFLFEDLLAKSNLMLIDQLLRQTPRAHIREFLAARRQQLTRQLRDWQDLAEHFNIIELAP